MSNFLTKAAALTAATAAVLATVSATVTPAQAVEFNFNWKGDKGYSAIGAFSYDDKAPEVISESGAGPTKFLQSFSLSFFDPTQKLLETGSSVVNGVSSDKYFRFDFDTKTKNVSVLDGDVGGAYIYFLSNLRTPNGDMVGPGVTAFNFFDRRSADAALDSGSSVQVTTVPEPTAVVGMLLAGGLGITLKRKKASVI